MPDEPHDIINSSTPILPSVIRLVNPPKATVGAKHAKYKNNILGIENKKLMRWGFAFHPEDIERTYPILDNFIDICRSNEEKGNDENILKYSDF